MKVQIEDNLYIESDALQFIVKEYTGKVSKDEKSGKETELYNILGYYTNVKSCVKHILTMKIKESTATTLAELLEDVKRIEMWIESKMTI
ncbi:MAG: hypothetical protein K0Q73_5436 [Paenibacillus sp.]|jgi:hypothetical protein|nr:hypothetical protein [Paenibacillus sp.]